ncbi:MAG: RNA methyltransferase [Fibrobacterota bacterium]
MPDERTQGGNRSNNARLITGINAVAEAVASGHSLESVLLLNNTGNARIFEVLKECRKRKVPVQLVPRQKLDFLTRQNHQGAIAFASVKEYVPLERLFDLARERNEAPLLVIPDGVEDPQNLGALMRTVLCAGAHGLILPAADSAGLSEGASRSSAGAIEHLAVHRTANMPGTLKAVKEAGVRLVGFEAGEGRPLWDTDLTGPLAVVLGGENRGIRPHIRRELSALSHLPLSGPLRSLNVSAAGAAVLFEVVRQRTPGAA